MTGEDIREALKWSMLATAVVALWCGVIAVGKAGAAIPVQPHTGVTREDRNPSDELRPVWVIIVYEMRNRKLIGIAEFVFASSNACQESAAEVKQKLGLRLRPGCYLRWMKEGASRKLGVDR